MPLAAPRNGLAVSADRNAGDLPALGKFADLYGDISYARKFVLFIALIAICSVISFALKKAY